MRKRFPNLEWLHFISIKIWTFLRCDDDSNANKLDLQYVYKQWVYSLAILLQKNTSTLSLPEPNRSEQIHHPAHLLYTTQYFWIALKKKKKKRYKYKYMYN